MKYKLGKLPAQKNSVSLRLRDYLALSKLPVPPTSVQANTDSNLFGNDKYGDCVCAGAGHETILWAKAPVTTDNVLAMYSDITGFDKNDPSTDNGTSVPQAAKWRKRTGLIDSKGNRHKISAYLSITPGNIEEVKQAIHLFGVCGIGWELPKSAQQQFPGNWTVVSNSPIRGGHYTASVGYEPEWLHIVTWGKQIKVSWEFFAKYCDEVIVYFSQEFMVKGKSPQGFNKTQLQADLRAL